MMRGGSSTVLKIYDLVVADDRGNRSKIVLEIWWG